MTRAAPRALVLAAGYGTRLAPLTAELPKPLLPVLGRPLLARTLDALVEAGCDAVAINLHHLAEAIPAAFGASYRGVPLVYSRETTILGTGGAFLPLRDFFAGTDVALLVNGDSLCDWPLVALLDRHRRSRAAATLLLAGRPDPRPFGGGIAVDRTGRVTAIRSTPTFGSVARRAVYAGAYALDPSLLERLPPGFSDSMRTLFEPYLAGGGRIASLLTWRPWHDLGTPGRYLDAMLARAARDGGDGWRAESATVSEHASVSHSVLEHDVAVGEGAHVVASLVLDGARIGAGSTLERVVVGPGASVPGATSWRSVLLTGAPKGAEDATLPARSRREGDLVVSPLEPAPG